jgi:diaminopimelate epimerase
MRHSLHFEKYQGCGNDFVLVDEMEEVRTRDEDRSALAKRLCDRHFGIGADGLIFIELADGCDGSMRLFEPAGNEADMCGNGLRCVAAYLSEKLGKDDLSILSRDGVKRVVKSDGQYRADMGPVRTLRRDLDQYIRDDGQPTDSMLGVPLYGRDDPLRVCILNTGEPHIVVFTEELSSVDVPGLGAELNSDRTRFPLGINLNFAQVNGPDEISVRTYERGVYNETMACGTGATACAAASLLSGRVSGDHVNVSTRGGVLRIDVQEDGRSFMTGPAERVFVGEATVIL